MQKQGSSNIVREYWFRKINNNSFLERKKDGQVKNIVFNRYTRNRLNDKNLKMY